MALSVAQLTMAQDKRLFTVDDLIPGGKTYYQNTPSTLYTEWWGDELVQLDMETVFARTTDGQSKSLFDLGAVNTALKKAGKKELTHLYYAKFPYGDKTLVLFETGGEQVLVDWSAGDAVWSQPVEKGASGKEFSAGSRNLAYTVDHNLYVVKANGEKVAVSTDGSIDLVYGETVHRNEFGIDRGSYWSPSGRLLAFYRMDQSMVTAYPQVDITTRCATLVPDKYPMAGETSHKVTVGIFDTESNKTVYLDAGDPTDRYFTNIAWSPDESAVYMIELNRDQNHARLVAYDAKTGKRKAVLFEETDEKYVEPMSPVQFLPWDDSKFIYQSRKDGYNHLYLYNTEGKQLAQLTKGAFEVIDFIGFNRKAKTVLYTSNETDPLQVNIYSVNMKGGRQRLDNGKGVHNATLSASGQYLADSYSSPDTPHNIDLVDTSGKKTAVNLLTADDPWSRFRCPEMKVGTIKAADDKTDLYYRLILPTDFDPGRKYPAVVYVYGGPHAHNIDASFHWAASGWDVWMAQQGYVMFCLDNRGSEHRGKDFEQVTFRHLGVEEMKDQLKGVEFLKSLPYVDAGRLGVHGWSFGGFMTTSLMATYPDVFKAGVAGGPVIDWKYYEVMYGERYMDTPQSNPQGYKETSLLNKAGNLKGRLLVIYGGNDNVCVPQHTLSFMRACIDAGTYPDLFTYPGDGHNMTGTDRVHLHNKITQYFNDYLK